MYIITIMTFTLVKRGWSEYIGRDGIVPKCPILPDWSSTISKAHYPAANEARAQKQ